MMLGKYFYCFTCTCCPFRRGSGLVTVCSRTSTCFSKKSCSAFSNLKTSGLSFNENYICIDLKKKMQVNDIDVNLTKLHSVSPTKSYEETVAALNGLQSNAVTILRSQKDPLSAKRNLLEAHRYLTCLEISQRDLKSLKVIHVAGTKGKGSTCAFTESILRASGFQTGFFSSPHLVVVRERIRINGKPLTQSDFVGYFWQVYNKITDFSIRENYPMPTYFLFLTLMSLQVFLQEKIDVAIVEVGVGGEYDCTNIIDSPAVVGLTSIGLDHISLLGDTLEKIAWQKAGILKRGVPAFTVKQPPGVFSVFLQRAQEAECPLYLSPNLRSYERKHCQQEFKTATDIQETNISLALQLSNAWIERYGQVLKSAPSPSTAASSLIVAEPFMIGESFEHGLQNCIWLGRFQKVQRGKVTYFLDGAHTIESVEICSTWFMKSSNVESVKLNNRNDVFRVLIFNCTRDRKPELLLPPLSDNDFDLALFCTNNVQAKLDSSSDISNFNADREKEIQQTSNNLNVWKHLQSCLEEEHQYGTSARASLSHTGCESLMLPFISDTLTCLEDPEHSDLNFNLQSEILKAGAIHVLVTGSLLLVGSVLSVIDPALKSA